MVSKTRRRSDLVRIEDYPFASILALAIAAFGVTGAGEYYYAFFAQFVYWIIGYSDLDGATDAIVGVQFGKGLYKHAMFASLLSLYLGFQDYNITKSFSYHNMARLCIFFFGYFLGAMNIL